MKLKALFAITLIATSPSLSAQEAPAWNTPGILNPFIPGYFADPTIRKFGDTFYIYATTDGTGNGYGPAQVWMSKDFVNWRNVVMNWPTTEVVWAPEVIPTPDGKYRYYYCTPCQVYVGESSSPVGPWTNMLGRPDAVLMRDRYCDPMAITLDPQVFTDDDGSQYIFVGTWGIYDNSGCGWARLAPDGKSFTDKGLVPNTQLKDFFEGPFVFKKDGVYYFTYSSGSCHDATYRVQYATSTVSPIGPYEYKGCILKSNEDGTVHGPGHHSILVDGDDYYIVYHRHNNPHSVHGFNRQLCIDKIEFDQNGDILPITPTHAGLLPSSLMKKAKKNAIQNLAYQAHVSASSVLGDDFKAEYAVDDNNATLWRPKNNQGESWLKIYLGKETQFIQVWLQFEYPTFFYQYKIVSSNDDTTW
ncbi:MAG: family 43 glycosylhydrolase, partial [Bacteroidaceae bacterium]|nr:family 43 glycosylhydrolase [Bacteroidaceae bacterium]